MAVDRAPVDGNANLVDGSLLVAAASPARIQLNNGSRATLGAHSAAKVFGDRLQLESGETLLTGGKGYRVEALGFQVAADGGTAQAVVHLKNGQAVVAALQGPVVVRNQQGLVLARVNPGRPLSLEPGTGGANESTMSGTLRQAEGRFMLRDEMTNLDVELRGNLAGQIGRRIQVTGPASASADRNSQVIQVARVNALAEPEQGGNRPAGGGGGGAATGMSAGAKLALTVGILAGVGLGIGVPLAVMSR